jgi:hypothetical protein
MDRYEALVKTRTLWSYIATHPKCKYKAEAYKALGLTADVNFCPCCQYASYSTPFGVATKCEKCPLYDLWPNGCVKYNTPYYVWNNNRETREGAQAAQAAGQIAKAADRIINKEYPDEQAQEAKKVKMEGSQVLEPVIISSRRPPNPVESGNISD